jgi:hypothetical protein
VSARIKKVHHGDGGLTTQATRTNKKEKIMKKMVALVLAGTMMAGMASVASAKNFDTPVWCNSTTNYTMADSEGDQKLNDTHAAIYVRHYDNVDTTEYTNHFRGIEVNSNYATRGSKWCTQGLNVPIQNNNIQKGRRYTVSARGNTNYYNNDGIERIWLNGSYNVNL